MNKRINISIDPVALGQLDYIAEDYGCNRSEAIELIVNDFMCNKRLINSVDELKVKEHIQKHLK